MALLEWGISGKRVPASPSIPTPPADTSDIWMKSSGMSRPQPVCQLDSKSWVSIASPQGSRDEPPPMNTVHVSNLQNSEQTKHSDLKSLDFGPAMWKHMTETHPIWHLRLKLRHLIPINSHMKLREEVGLDQLPLATESLLFADIP